MCSADKARRTASRQLLEEESQQLAHTWTALHRHLTGQWSLWATAGAAPHTPRFSLDLREDSLRRRMRLKRNHRFVMYDAPPPVKTPREGVEDAEAVAEELGALLKGGLLRRASWICVCVCVC